LYVGLVLTSIVHWLLLAAV
jgi:hypothetical protein